MGDKEGTAVNRCSYEKERLAMNDEQTDPQQEEKAAYWEWWNKTGRTLVNATPMDVWLAGIAWARAEERSMYDTPEV
jgi:hypothetical protein